jgi:site-specific DNA-cytosine methylase
LLNISISFGISERFEDAGTFEVHLVVDLRPAALTTTKKLRNKLIINQNVLLRTPIYMKKKKGKVVPVLN